MTEFFDFITMYHFFFAIYAITFSVLSGTIAVAAIVMGYFSWTIIITAMIVGAVLSLPATYAILKQMDWTDPDEKHGTQKEWWYRR